MGLNIIPSDLSDLTEGEQRIASKIKSFYAESLIDSYLYVKPRLRNLEPDFIIIDPTKGICIIEVKDWTFNFIKDADRTKVSTITGQVLYNPIFRANQYFNLAKGLFDSDIRLLDEMGNPAYNLFSKVILCNISSSDAVKIATILDQYPTRYVTSDQIRGLTLDQVFDIESCFISPDQLLVLRTILFPEIKISDIEALEFEAADTGEIYTTIKALDSQQEQFAKRLPNGHYMISGVPGSGKTVILLSRAIFLLKENPDWKIQIVTYNRSLSYKLENRIEHLSRDLDFLGMRRDNITVSTFSKLALEVANIGIPQNAGSDFWNYELPKKAFEKATPIYDAILIDEYQDFYDDWLKLCLKLAKKYTIDGKEFENIFLAGDRLQSIYNPNEHSWSSIGINIQGRSKLLKHTYRAGKSHINLALKLLMSDPKLKKEVRKFYDGKDGIDNQTNLSDTIEFIEGEYSSISILLHDLLNRVGFKPSEILILSPTWQEANTLYAVLPSDIQSKCKVTKDIIDNKLIITTYHSSKGLENKICILLNIEKVDDRKRIYVGMTRASQRLYIHSRDFTCSSISEQLRRDTFTEAVDEGEDNNSFFSINK